MYDITDADSVTKTEFIPQVLASQQAASLLLYESLGASKAHAEMSNSWSPTIKSTISDAKAETLDASTGRVSLPFNRQDSVSAEGQSSQFGSYKLNANLGMDFKGPESYDAKFFDASSGKAKLEMSSIWSNSVIQPNTVKMQIKDADGQMIGQVDSREIGAGRIESDVQRLVNGKLQTVAVVESQIREPFSGPYTIDSSVKSRTSVPGFESESVKK